MAVKILERLTPYYFSCFWDNKPRAASVLAHNIDQPHDSKVTNRIFLSQVFGIPCHTDYEVDKIIRLKLLFPNYPVYISMKYGEVGSDPNEPDRHALRIDKVIPDEKIFGNYQFILVNPWNNQTTETHTLNALIKAECNFCIYITNPNEYALMGSVLELPSPHDQYVITNPVLLEIIRQAKQTFDTLDDKSIMRCVSLYQQMEYIPTLFDAFTEDMQTEFIHHLFQVTEKDQLLGILLKKLNHPLMSQCIIRHESRCLPLTSQQLAILALRNQDHSIYEYLMDNKFDFFKLLHGTLNAEKNIFLSHMAEFEKARRPLNVNQLNLIAAYIQRHNLNFPSRPLSFVFNENTITAIVKKQSERDEAQAKLEEIVHEIDALSVCFDSCYSIAALQFQASSLRQELSTLVKHERFTECILALDLLPDQKPRKIQKALIRKNNEIAVKLEQRDTKISQAISTVKTCESAIHHFPISLDGAKSDAEIDEVCKQLTKKLTDFIDNFPKLDEAHTTLGLGHRWHKTISSAFRIYEHDMTSRAEKLKKEIKSALKFAENIFQQIEFNETLNFVKVNASQLNRIAHINSAHRERAKAAKDLYATLNTAKTHFLFSKKSEIERLIQFKKEALHAFSQAHTLLSQRYGWNSIFYGTAKKLRYISTTNPLPEKTNKHRFFTKEEHSADIEMKDTPLHHPI